MIGKRQTRRTHAGVSLPTVSAATETQNAASSQETDLRAEFHRQYNISYVAPGLSRPPLKLALKHYLASALVYGSVLLFYTVNPWFRTLLGSTQINGFSALRGYWCAYVIYLMVSPLVLVLLRPRSVWVSKNVYTVRYFKRLIGWLGSPTSAASRGAWKPSYQEQHVLMFLLLKLIYGPLMINCVVTSYNSIVAITQHFPRGYPLPYVLDACYAVFFYVVFLLDPAVSAFSYHFESGLLGNKLRCTDTHPFHIFVCLVCYPPFNLATAAVFGPSYPTAMILWHNNLAHPATWVLRGLNVLALLFMLSASLSLGTRATNLTNRGIVDWGPFRLIRHPGYVSKNLFWLLTLIPFFAPNKADPAFTWPKHVLLCASLLGGFLGWGALYYFRAMTEEAFLRRDPDYVAYCKKVRYRFIPWVY
jgi:protein-S-isoprenylcysteine O-methyltransferase Ste14